MKKQGHRTSYPLFYLCDFGKIFYFYFFPEMLKFSKIVFFFFLFLMKETHGLGTHGGT